MKTKNIIFTIFVIITANIIPLDKSQAGTKYYTIFAFGTGYRDFITEEPDNHFTLISPYIEYGVEIRRRLLTGFNSMLMLEPTNSSKLILVQFGGQLKYFIISRFLYFGGGPGLTIEGENIERNKNSDTEEDNAMIHDPKVFPNANVHLGLSLYLFKGNSIIFDTSFSQSFRSPFPYSLSFMMGLLTLY